MSLRRLFILFIWVLFPIVTLGQNLQLADSLFEKGRFYDDQGKMKQSAFYYSEAYDIYRQHRDTVSWLQAGKEYASALVYRSKNKRAMELYKMLLKVKHPANDTYNLGDIYNSMGWSSRRIGKLEQALNYYQKSLPLALESGDSLLIGIVFNNIGRVYHQKGNYPQSLKLYRKSLPYLKSLDNLASLAAALNNIGSIYDKLSLFNKALEYFNQSLTIRKQLADVSMLATIYTNIANIQRDLGNYNQSLIAYQKSLEYRHQASIPQSTEATLSNIGLLYKNLGQYDKALDYYRQSLAIAEEASGPASVATTIRNIAMVFWEQRKYEQAGQLYKKALALRKEINNPYDIAYSLNDLIRMELKAGNYPLASQYAAELEAIGDSTGSYNILSDAYDWVGKIENERKDFRQALTHFKKAYAYSQFLSQPKQIIPLINLAEAYHKLNSEKAVVFGQKAVNIIEENRTKAGAVSELKSGYFKRYADFYIQLASWVLNYHRDTAEAFRLVELAKARSLSDELAKAVQNIEQQLPEKVRIERNQKRYQINELFSKLEGETDSGRRSDIKQEIQAAELSYAAYESSLSSEYPELRRLKSPEPVSLKEARALVDERTAVLEYAIAGNRLTMVFITQKNVRIEQVSLKDENREGQLSVLVESFRDAILANAALETLSRHSKKLYNLLIKPFEQDLNKYKNLIIVPDGVLAYLPFEALLQGGRYLIENHHIKYEPSLTSLALLKPTETRGKKRLLAVAGSQFSQGGIGNFRKSTLSSLPSTLTEVDSIAAHFEQPSVLKRTQVSEQAVKKMLRQNRYKYIHLATHGIIDEEHPRRSGLALSTKGTLTASSREDGMLRKSEIFSLRLDSDMVVLSACNTGLGKVVSGEGMLGMQRAFFFAGASTVVVSLWNVYDRSTSFLMNQFYKAILKDDEQEGWMESLLRWAGWDDSIPFGQKASAMRKAKLQMIEHPLFNHPVYWAPFIVVGR